MSKSSTVTVRALPVSDVAMSSGGIRISAETLEVATTERVELVDLTDRIRELVRGAGAREGIVSLWSMHTTCGLFINEHQAALAADIKTFLEAIASRDATWLHNDPAHSDCDRMNADSHLRAMVLGHSLTVQVSGGDLVLGQWQRLLMAELDGPRPRAIRVQVLGIA